MKPIFQEMADGINQIDIARFNYYRYHDAL
jgi:ACT domain-containing protein